MAKSDKFDLDSLRRPPNKIQISAYYSMTDSAPKTKIDSRLCALLLFFSRSSDTNNP